MKYNNVILISVDALRADYLHCFEDLFNIKCLNYKTNSTWTLPAHLEMLASKKCNKSIKGDIKKLKNFVKNDKTIATDIKEKLGWKTRASVGGGYMDKYFGWGNDWDKWDNQERDWKGEEICTHNNEFLFIHTYYLHNWWHDFPKYRDVQKKKMLYKYKIKCKKCYEKRLLKFIKNLRWIKKTSPNTLICLTADHGESLGENNQFTHGVDIRSDVIYHIPLMFRTPDKKQKEVLRPIMAIELKDILLKIIL